MLSKLFVNLRFNTTFAIHQKLTQYKIYKWWHESKYSPFFHLLLIAFFIISLAGFLYTTNVKPAFAYTNNFTCTWTGGADNTDWTNPSNWSGCNGTYPHNGGADGYWVAAESVAASQPVAITTTVCGVKIGREINGSTLTITGTNTLTVDSAGCGSAPAGFQSGSLIVGADASHTGTLYLNSTSPTTALVTKETANTQITYTGSSITSTNSTNATAYSTWTSSGSIVTITNGGSLTGAWNYTTTTGYSFTNNDIVDMSGGTFTTGRSAGTSTWTCSGSTNNFYGFTAGGVSVHTTYLNGTCAIKGALTVNAGMSLNYTTTPTIILMGSEWSLVNNSGQQAWMNFYNLTVAGTPSSQSSSSFQVNRTLTVNNGISFAPIGGEVKLITTSASISNSGNLNFYDLYIQNNITNTASFSVAHNLYNNASFVSTNGTITLNGGAGTIQTIGGQSITFYSLNATGTGARTIKFSGGSTYAATNSWVSTGASGQLLTLTSTTTTPWQINPLVTSNISYVDMSYVSNSYNNTTVCATYSQSTSGNVTGRIAYTNSADCLLYYAKSTGSPNFAATDGSPAGDHQNSGTPPGTVNVWFGKCTGACSTQTWWVNGISANAGLDIAQQALSPGEKLVYKWSLSGGTSPLYISNDVGTAYSNLKASHLYFYLKVDDNSYEDEYEGWISIFDAYSGGSRNYIAGINFETRIVNINPNNPSSLTQKTSPADTAINESAYTTDNTPNLGFTISDPDGSDTVKYQVQVTNAADTNFASTILDYTHGSLSANGTTFAFTVGSYGGGTCTGTCPAALSNSASGYLWRVKAIDNSGAVSGWSEHGVTGTMDFKVDASGPSAPSGLNFTSLAPTSFTLNWTASTDIFSGLADPAYHIHRAPDIAGTPGTLVEIGTSNTTSFADSSLSPNTRYWYKVRAIDNLGNHAYSVWADTTTLTNVPESFAAAGVAPGRINLSWGAPVGGAASYDVYSSSDNYSVPIYTGSTLSTFQTGLSPNTSYTYRIYGVNEGSAESATYAIDSAYTLTNVPVLNALSVYSNNNKPAISNSDNADSSLANMVVHLYDGTTEVASVTSNGSGIFTFNLSSYSAPLTEGLHDTIRVRAENTDGVLSSYSDPVNTTVDVTVPGTSDNTTTGWHNTNVTVTLTCSDSISGCADTYYTTDGSNPTVSSPMGTVINLNSDGVFAIKYFSVDNAGNQETVKTAVNQARIDKTDPSAPGTPAVTTPANDNTPNWQWTASADNGSGLSNPAYSVEWSKDSNFSIDVSTASVATNSFTHSSALSDGKWYFRVKSSDLAGNQTDFSTGSFTVNTYVPPSTPSNPSNPSPSNPPTSEEPTPTQTETPATPAPTPTTEEKVTQKPSTQTENETFIDTIVEVFQAVPGVVTTIGRTVWSTANYTLQIAGYIAVDTGKSAVNLYNGLTSCAKSVVNFTTEFSSGVVYGSKNLVAVISFSIGEKTEILSGQVGRVIVQIGYVFIGEPTQIYNVKVSDITKDSARISWETNIPADAKVNYGLNETYEKTVQSSKHGTHHSFVLTNLKPDTQYHFEVMSQGKTYVYDANRKFRTLK